MLEIRERPLTSGLVVARKYRLERQLGEGGMGVVWSAVETATERWVALKFLRAGRETDLSNQERILREARAAMSIQHPNVAKVEAVLETDAGVPFIVMELLEGKSLRALLDRRKTLPVLECVELLVPALDAVAAAHAIGIVHRDVKPENIFIERRRDGGGAVEGGPATIAAPAGGGGVVKVLDFGIAKRLPSEGEGTASASLTSTGVMLGTPVYMAPEQVFADSDIDTRVDVWAFGIILYECLAGKRPTEGAGFGQILRRITTDTLEPLEQARPGLPKRITRLVTRMLSRDRTLRPSLIEARDVLASLLAEAPVPSEPVPTLRMHDAGSQPGMLVASAQPGLHDHGSRPAMHAASSEPAMHAVPPQMTTGMLGRGASASGAGAEAPRASSSGPPADAPTAPPPAPSASPLRLVLGAVVVTGVLAVAAAAAAFAFVQSRAAPAEPPPFVLEAGPPPAVDAATTFDNQRSAEFLWEAARARGVMDGAACLRALDNADKLRYPGMPPSTDPVGGYALVRAECLMFEDRCEEGKRLYRAGLDAQSAGLNTAEQRASATESTAERACPSLRDAGARDAGPRRP